jgi:hypothetical protein
VPDIRTTFQPGTVRTVSDSEFLDLKRQGLIKEVVPPPAPVAPAPKPTAKTRPTPTPKVFRTSTTTSNTDGDSSE